MVFNPEKMYIGRSCLYGHDGIRYKSGGSCVECSKQYYQDNKDKRKELVKELVKSGYFKEQYQKHKERKKEQTNEQNRKYYHEHREARMQQLREYYRNNTEQFKAKLKEYHQNNPHLLRAANKKRHTSKMNRCPKWADLEKIKQFYKNCPKGYEVDHIYPLQGKLVSGLHVHNNLQYLTKSENCSKNNKVDPLLLKWVIYMSDNRTTWPITPRPPARHNVLESKKVFTIRSQTAMVNSYAWQCCLNCDHWSKTSQQQVPDETKYAGYRLEDTGPKCMKFNVLPPPEVIVTGCEQHEDSIPF